LDFDLPPIMGMAMVVPEVVAMQPHISGYLTPTLQTQKFDRISVT
jgi:hypothetical protein